MTEQSKSAYETIKLSEREQDGQYTDQVWWDMKEEEP